MFMPSGLHCARAKGGNEQRIARAVDASLGRRERGCICRLGAAPASRTSNERGARDAPYIELDGPPPWVAFSHRPRAAPPCMPPRRAMVLDYQPAEPSQEDGSWYVAVRRDLSSSA